MKVGILGGTFDPIHQGHLALGRCAQEQLGLDKILFIPAFIPPHKAGRHDLTPAPYRYRMVELAIAGEPAFEISPMELNRPDISYTVDTLRALKKKNPAAELYLILGEDALAEMEDWREPDEIRRLATLLVARREGKNLPFGPSEKKVWLNMPVCPYSSSEIRRLIQDSKPVSSMLPAGVGDYIREMKLYQKTSHGNPPS
ncbi:MAG TPA: nicotinate-nucleotide adenylyltransferase [bacterium]|nr:nicotinate-nucleotide adenylyltransferase [bacterium]